MKIQAYAFVQDTYVFASCICHSARHILTRFMYIPLCQTQMNSLHAYASVPNT